MKWSAGWNLFRLNWNPCLMIFRGIMDEETEYRDNIPENMQGGDRYEMADNACSELEAAHETLDNAKDSLEEVVSSLESAAE